MDIEELKTAFINLTGKALPEEDVDKFIQHLLEREPYSMDLINHMVTLEKEEARDLLSKETRILERLKEERTKLLNQMEKHGRSRKASKAYSPRFPFPALPVFFDKSE